MLDPLYNAFGAALAFFYAIVPNEGVAIILLTISVMLLLFPLTAKSARSMLAMQRLQPEMKKLQAKHKGDRQKLNEEMMKLYQENKVNPLGGCLPLVVQFPVFIALFHVLRSTAATVPTGSSLYKAIIAAEPNGLTFLGMDLSLKATDNHGDLLTALPYYILVGAVFLTGFLQSRQSQRNTPPGANAQMQMITKVLPIAFGAFSLFFPAGLVLYFLVSNLWRLGQQELIMRKIAPRDHLRKGGAIDARSSPSKREGTEGPSEPAETVEPARAERPKPAPPVKPAAPAGRQSSPLAALRDLFRPPADGNSGGTPAAQPSQPKPAASKQPASKQPAARQGGSGRTIEEALDAALDELGVDENDVEYEVMARPRGGILGRFGGEARIRARVKPISREKPGEPRRRPRRRGPSGGREEDRAGERRTRTGPRSGARGDGSQENRGVGPARNRRRRSRGGGSGRGQGQREEREQGANVDDQGDIPVDEQADQAVEFTRGLVEAFGAKAEVASHLEDEDTVLVDVTGENLGLLVGPRGATLAAVEELVRTVVQRQTGGHGVRVHVDVAGYRAKRREALSEFARQLAERVRDEDAEQALEPMSASDRKVVHDVVAEIEGVTTTSEGEEPRRRVVIRPA